MKYSSIIDISCLRKEYTLPTWAYTQNEASFRGVFSKQEPGYLTSWLEVSPYNRELIMRKKHILIINQHGENRGDESALRAMLHGLEKRLEDDTAFTVIVQFQDTSLQLDFDQDVTLLHMKMSLVEFALMVLYSLLRKIKITLPFLLCEQTRDIIKAYEKCDIVVSAPGGPYFGDIYANHEILHWYYVWLADLFKKPLFLYAPSAGPFTGKILNIVRKYFYKKFDIICLREEISKKYLENLLGKKQEIIVTADSAIQQIVKPYSREEYFQSRNSLAKKFLVAVSAIEYKFPGESDPQKKQQEYTDALIDCLKYLTEIKECHFLFVPQLYGKVHSDMNYLVKLSEKLPPHTSWEIVSQELNSDKQRAIFGMCDLCIASRYHPQVFAGTSNVPGICIYYEHKALGFMQFLGMEDFAFDIRSLDVTAMKKQLTVAITEKEAITNTMKKNIKHVRQRSSKTSELLVDLIQRKTE